MVVILNHGKQKPKYLCEKYIVLYYNTLSNNIEFISKKYLINQYILSIY